MGNTLASIALFFLISCSDNKAAGVNSKKPEKEAEKKSSVTITDGPSIGSIETENYMFKLHRAFEYKTQGSEVLAGLKPKQGYKFIYLDVSLKNKSVEKLDGGFLFIALKVTDDKGVEYKKPATGLAAYTSENPIAGDEEEYNELWETFQQNEFHRAVVYCVEVLVPVKNFVLHMPTDSKRKEWKTINFSL